MAMRCLSFPKALKFEKTFAGLLHPRYAHTDTRPDFSEIRATGANEKQRTPAHNSYHYLASAGLVSGLLYTSKLAVTSLLDMMNPAANVLALSSIVVDLSKIPEGKSMTFKWSGKPVFIRHRTPEEIERENNVDLSSLRDPQHDKDRAQDQKFLIVVGICTHLGCVPIANAGLYGGYYCPCHGSHYDGSGRIRQGPAPLNLPVPKHEYVEPTVVKIG